MLLCLWATDGPFAAHAAAVQISTVASPACNVSGNGPVCGFRAAACGSLSAASVTHTFAVKGTPAAVSVTISLPDPNAAIPTYQLDVKFANGYSPVPNDTVRNQAQFQLKGQSLNIQHPILSFPAAEYPSP